MVPYYICGGQTTIDVEDADVVQLTDRAPLISSAVRVEALRQIRSPGPPYGTPRRKSSRTALVILEGHVVGILALED